MKQVMKRRPIISVVLPAFNAQQYLPEALESILKQSFRDFEIIAIDDGSTDATRDVLNVYAKRDPRIHVYSRENRGLVATLNEGIERCRGDYIARMDADDIAFPKRFERQLEWLNKTGSDICGCYVEIFGQSSGIWKYPVTHKGCEVQLVFDVPFAHPSILSKRKVFDRLRYSSSFPYSQDYDLWQRIWEDGYIMSNVPEVLLRYRQHHSQISIKRKSTQIELSNLIRRRHVLSLLGDEYRESAIKLTDAITYDGEIKITDIAPLLKILMEKYKGEARDVLLFHAFRVFCRLAANNRNVWIEWYSMTKGYRSLNDAGRIIVLVFLSSLKLKPGSNLFSRLKNIYLK